jgi:hypothetical protein
MVLESGVLEANTIPPFLAMYQKGGFKSLTINALGVLPGFFR